MHFYFILTLLMVADKFYIKNPWQSHNDIANNTSFNTQSFNLLSFVLANDFHFEMRYFLKKTKLSLGQFPIDPLLIHLSVLTFVCLCLQHLLCWADFPWCMFEDVLGQTLSWVCTLTHTQSNPEAVMGMQQSDHLPTEWLVIKKYQFCQLLKCP